METCKTCGEPLYREVCLFNDKNIQVARMCACQRAHEEQDAKEREQLEKAKKIHAARKICFDNPVYASMTFDNDKNHESQERHITESYAKNFLKMKESGSGLLIFGKPDASKTFYSSCIANAVLDMGCSVIMEKPARIIAKVMKQGFNKDYVSELSKIDLLILDDFGTESGSEYRQEVMYDVIDSRFKKPLIVTTNLTKEEILSPSNVSDERLFGRILDCCMPVEFKQVNIRWSRDYSDVLSIL